MALKQALLTILFFLVFSTLAGARENLSFPVAASSKVLGFAPLWVASGKGFLEREGFDAIVTTIRGTAPTMRLHQECLRAVGIQGGVAISRPCLESLVEN